MIIGVSILSFILEYVVNGFFHGTIFSGLIIFSSLVLLEPYFKKNRDMFYVYCFFIGLLYDFVYTGVYFMDSGMFLIIGILVSFFNRITPNNFVVSVFELVLMICFYRFICFVFLGLNGYIVMSFDVLFRSIYSSILINLIYGVLLYFVLFLLSKRFNIRRIN